MTDPLRPPDTDDEPWPCPADWRCPVCAASDRHRSGEWAVACFLLLVLLIVVAWKVGVK